MYLIELMKIKNKIIKKFVKKNEKLNIFNDI